MTSVKPPILVVLIFHTQFYVNCKTTFLLYFQITESKEEIDGE